MTLSNCVDQNQMMGEKNLFIMKKINIFNKYQISVQEKYPFYPLII